MADAAVIFERVWKKFRKGERRGSLQELIPAMAKRILRPLPPERLADGEFWALRDVSFEVNPGEALGIMGPNGAGKSTTLKLLTRILKPTLGHCEVRGRVGALIELAAGFHPDLTGRENVYLQGAIMGMSRPDIARRFDEIVGFAGVEDFVDTPVKRYSSGMQARLGFAIAAHLEPDVLLIDEVLAVGDFTFQQRCFERLAHFRNEGIPIVFVSHNLQAIARLCNRALLLSADHSPVVGATADITARWLASESAASDPRASLTEASLRLASGEALPETIRAGVPLLLSLDFQIGQPLARCGVVVHVVRSDGHEIFLGASNIDTTIGFDLVSGQTLEARIMLHPHLLKGVYLIHVRLLDADRRWPAVVFPNVASFTVDETTRVAGCTELYPSYTLTVRPSSTAGGAKNRE